jgi:2'-5' RNA ligase
MPGIEKPLRLFIAVDLPEDIKKTLSALGRELATTGADVAWVASGNCHLTIKFLGAVRSEKIIEIAGILNACFSGRERFNVTLHELGCFPTIASPKIVWAGLEDDKQILKGCALSVETRLSQCGFEKEKRGFQAHVTLGRIRSPRNKDALTKKIVETNQRFEKKQFLVDNVTLFESRLAPQGPTYSVVHQVKLK